MAERIEMREFPSKPPPFWKKTKKQYFQKDPPKFCYIENDKKISGTPLWPKDPLFHPENLEIYLQIAKEEVQRVGGKFFSGHIPLSPTRTIKFPKDWLKNQPERLTTTFTSGFLLPATAVLESRAGFYIKEGEVPSLQETVKNMKGTWLLSNLGYFLTPKLIKEEKEGGLATSHNSRHPVDEHLPVTNNCYLGGFFIRNNNEWVVYQWNVWMGGVGITKEGKPVLVNDCTLRGGAVWIDDKKYAWNAGDVNPETPNNKAVIIYTPSLRTKGNDWQNYRRFIGENRFNIIITNEGLGNYPQPKIAYVKAGSCLQPADAIVISLQKYPDNIIDKNGFVRFEFEPWFDKKIWDNLACFYEGVLPLSPEGLKDFGVWQHPHACMTQETFIPNRYRREPRTVLVKTNKSFGAFAFSGRYEYSIGISFEELPLVLNKIVNHLAPDETIQQIMGLDGGSGAKLCLIKNGEVGALNWVAPGFRNRIGDPNGNTYSCLLLKIAP